LKKKRRDRSVGRPSVGDLQMMFLKAIGTGAPEAIEDLFLTRDAEEWARKYNVKAKWLVDFASHARRLNSQGWVANQPSRDLRDVALATWAAAIARRRGIVGALDDAAIKVDVTFDDETLDKRSDEAHCRWLALWLFVPGMTDDVIAKRENVAWARTVQKKRAELARILEIELPPRRGRPRKIQP
jgi:hypothetical protein